VLTVNVPGQGPVKLRMDEGTCAVQARRALLTESLLEGPEVRVSYVMEDGLPTARLVRAEPQRYLKCATRSRADAPPESKSLNKLFGYDVTT
jgi:hypothetical protein